MIMQRQEKTQVQLPRASKFCSWASENGSLVVWWAGEFNSVVLLWSITDYRQYLVNVVDKA